MVVLHPLAEVQHPQVTVLEGRLQFEQRDDVRRCTDFPRHRDLQVFEDMPQAVVPDAEVDSTSHCFCLEGLQGVIVPAKGRRR